jgi:3',5'-nucleoside bisphosphate phosphatase
MPVTVRPRRADFHTHSTASDGTLTPAELVRESALRGLSIVAVTDHDTTAGVTSATQEGKRLGVTVIPGIEFSSETERGELHILGYGIDTDNERLQARIADLRLSRLKRSGQILERLAGLGISLNREVIQRPGNDHSTGRPHIARALVAAGVVRTVSEAFDLYLSEGRPAFVSKALIPPAEAIDLIRQAGGIAVLAHPFSVPDLSAILPVLVENGLAGLECYYGEYDENQRRGLADLAQVNGLLPTGGSDYHGPGFREGRQLGSVEMPEDVIDGVLTAIGMSSNEPDR